METRLILGGPGCGKTTRLLDILEEELEEVSGQKVAFVAFTNAAANEAKDRAAKRFHQNLPWFRTIHSFAYRVARVMHDEVMQRDDWKRFSKVIGERVTGSSFADASGSISKGDRILQLIDFSKNIGSDLKETWKNLNIGISWWEIERFSKTLDKYKKHHGKIDFTDMLLLSLETDEPIDIEVAFIDEAQDLTPLQWKVVEHGLKRAERRYIGGDDDQAIHEWGGADVERFLSFDAEQEILPTSHRLPREIFRFSQCLAHRIRHRYEKPFESTDRSGSVLWHQTAETIDFSEGTWFILARNGYQLEELRDIVANQGYLYNMRRGKSVRRKHVDVMEGWETLRKGKKITANLARRVLAAARLRAKPLNDALEYSAKDLGVDPKIPWYDALINIPLKDRVYYRACRRRGEKLLQEPRITIDTIHGVKGREADHVVLTLDMSKGTFENFRTNPDSEHRVYYVGATRARETLNIVRAQTHMSYPLAGVTI